MGYSCEQLNRRNPDFRSHMNDISKPKESKGTHAKRLFRLKGMANVGSAAAVMPNRRREVEVRMLEK